MAVEAMTVEEKKEQEDEPYVMTLSLNVLRHLGLNLYSNVPAVVAEAVANSWDADAEEVEVSVYPNEEVIEIKDDGNGMDKNDVNNRYLNVGYRRREDEKREKLTPEFDRPVMGRKGIGKLSLFSIAKTVEIYSRKDGDENAFRMEVDAIKEAITEEEKSDGEEDDEAKGEYAPTPITDEFPEDLAKEGTKIVLKDLKKRVHRAATALRKRIARRFSVIGPEYNFSVKIDGEEVKVTDRDYFHKVQFLWHYGDDGEDYVDYCENLEEHESRDNSLDGGYEVSGWIATAEQPKDLEESYPGEETDSDDLNKITLMVRGRMAQKDLMENFNDGRFYTKYLVGEIHADFLDLDDKEDTATSARDSIIQDDPRFQKLKEFVQEELSYIRSEWDDLRSEKGAERAREIPEIDEWYESLSPDKKKQAKKHFGKINQISTDDEEDKKELFKQGVIAFEKLRYKESLHRLEEVSASDLEGLTRAFVDLDDIEATLYHQIVTQRLEMIDKMRKKVQQNALEKVLQEHLYEHPWLLDPSWERATEEQWMESSVTTKFDKVTSSKLTKEERRGRLDLKYLKTSGQHVIVELKRPGRKINVYNVIDQISDYRDALKKALETAGRGNEPIETVVVLGSEPKKWETNEEKLRGHMKQEDAQIKFYQELLDDAYNAYEEYLEKRKEAENLSALLEKIDAGGAFTKEEAS